MSYSALNGLGLGDGLGCCGLGAIDFNAGSVWDNWKAGAAGNAAAGKLAAQSMQAGLNQIGYGPLLVDGQFGGGSLAAWKRFATDNGTGDAAWPTQAGIIKLGEMVTKGGDQGGGGVIESHVSGGQFIPGAAPGTQPLTAKAGMSTGMMLGLGALVIGGVALMAVAAKKKRTSTAAKV